MEQPLGWETEGKPREDYVCRLNRSMYGLLQAPHCAQRKLKATLTASDQFKPTTADDCVYDSQDQDNYSALGAHVDDLLGIGDSAGLQKITDTLTQNLKIPEQRIQQLLLAYRYNVIASSAGSSFTSEPTSPIC